MNSGIKTIAVVVILIVIIAIGLRWAKNALLNHFISANIPPPEVLYPAAPAMPPVVGATMDELLQQLDNHLKSKAPALINAMQAGLTDEQLTTIERENSITLPPDIKALYKWHNGCAFPKPGTAVITTLGPIPGKHFLPLDEALKEKVAIQNELKKADPIAQRAYKAVAAHRDTWVCIFSDGAGDGYFFDTKRSESEGAVFYTFTESGDFIFFPSIKNLIAGIEKCYATGIFQPSKSNAADWEEAYFKSRPVWLEFGAAPKLPNPH